MPQPLFRTFSDAAGRPWRVSELFAMPIAPELLAGTGEADPPIPLLFVSGNERRWVSHGPIQWWDVAEEKLIRLLADARALPHWVASFAGLVDE